MEHRHLWRPMLHSNRIFSYHQRHQGFVLHDSSCKGLDTLQHWLKVNVLKVVVLLGTFALAMAFAGNDLVNFIGVPLTGLASFQDFTASGATDAHTHMMGVLNNPANTPIYFLIGAGAIMVFTLATSKKARNVTKTQNGLCSQSNSGDEMFGSSRIGRRLVRCACAAGWTNASAWMTSLWNRDNPSTLCAEPSIWWWPERLLPLAPR